MDHSTPNGVHPPEPPKASLSPSTLGIHADDALASYPDVAPAVHTSTTFRYANNPAELRPAEEWFSHPRAAGDPIKTFETHVYSRMATPNLSRLEAVLSALMHGKTITYGSGLAAFHAMLVYFNPKVVAIGAGYHGCHGLLRIQQKLTGVKQVDLFDEASWDAIGLGKGDIVHVETPLNPTGEAYNIAEFAAKAHKRGAILTVDATFGPPGLQDPFLHDADVIMHSGTKYLGGHSDMLCGVLALKNEEWWKGLFGERLLLGSTPGSLEGWLGLRSLRTLELRVQRQSQNATALVSWLDASLRGDTEDSKVVQTAVERVQHASLQKDEMGWLKKQMPSGFGPVFAIWMKDADKAKTLPSKLDLFHHATSLGGVESLIEWRRMTDNGVDPRLLRVSVGIENFEDLKSDFRQAFTQLSLGDVHVS